MSLIILQFSIILWWFRKHKHNLMTVKDAKDFFCSSIAAGKAWK